MTYDEATKEVIVSRVLNGLARGGALQPLLDSIGVWRASWVAWLDERPEWRDAYVRTRESWADMLVEECPAIAKDKELDPKTRRVIIDTNLRVAALYAPKRYSQAALDRIVAPPEELEQISPQEIARELMRAVEVAGRLQLPAPADDIEDADFDDT